MNTSTVRRSTILSAACAVALLGAAAAFAAPSQKAVEVLGSPAAVPSAQLPAHARASSGLVGALNINALSAPAIGLTLADGRTVTARLKRVARDDKRATQSWIGTVDGAPGSIVVLSKARGVVTGFANVGTETLEIMPSAGGKHVLYSVDNSRLPAEEVVRKPRQKVADTSGTTGDFGTGTSTLTVGDAIVQDLLVVYTAKAAARYGVATLESMIQSAVQSGNQAYANSGVGITLNLVGMAQTSVTEASNMDSTLTAVQASSEVARLRDSVAADVVMAVTENGDYCGLANLMTSNSTSFASQAYGAVFSSCLSNQSLVHEIGHVLGLMHDRDSSSGWTGVYPYSYGYRVCVSDGTGFRDIMSYSCSGAPRVLLFSNPYVSYNGHPAGIAYEANPSQSAENTRSLNNTAKTVAAFRGASSSTATAPAAPTSLAVNSATYDKVSLAWADNATNETGFKLERSTDGVNFAEIATLGADTKAYTDGTVTALTTYYYRVRAFNSVGASGYSSSVNVRTPDVPPPPPPAPTSLVVGDNGNGTATVSWTTGATNASSFEVRREKWDSRKSVWTGATTAAKVPSSVLSIVDSTGAGTYRYSVRASNSGGASAYAGPASVLVTSSDSSSTKKPPPGKGR